MLYTLVGELPRHLYVWVDSAYTHQDPQGFIPAVWYGLVSYPGRCWGATVLLESGAIYRNVPCHALAFNDWPEPEWTPQDAQTWDCYAKALPRWNTAIWQTCAVWPGPMVNNG